MRMNNLETIVPKLRFPEFVKSNIIFLYGNILFKDIDTKPHNTNLTVLAITQDYGAVPRNQIDYNVSVTKQSLSNYKLVEVGDFVISLRSFQGGIEYSQFRGICSPAYIVLRKKKKSMFDLYYKYYFKTDGYIRRLNKYLEGIRDGKAISYSQFSFIKIPYPKALQEQKKIAECLSSIDELIEKECAKLNLLNNHKKGLMQKLFPPEGRTIPEWRFPEFKQSDKWKPKTIGKSCKMFSGGTPDTSENEFYGGDIPFIRSAEIGKGFTESFITKEGLKNSSSRMVKKGDILIALYGANSGEVALSQIDGAINQAVLCLRHETNNVFLYHYLTYVKSRIVSKYIQGGQGNLSNQIIKSIKLYFPKSGEQKKIAECLSELEFVITRQAEKVEKLKMHKKGLMQGLFPSIEGVDL